MSHSNEDEKNETASCLNDSLFILITRFRNGTESSSCVVVITVENGDGNKGLSAAQQRLCPNLSELNEMHSACRTIRAWRKPTRHLHHYTDHNVSVHAHHLSQPHTSQPAVSANTWETLQRLVTQHKRCV